jgi:hypothetical protein
MPVLETLISVNNGLKYMIETERIGTPMLNHAPSSKYDSVKKIEKNTPTV